MGACVNRPNDISSVLRSLSNKSVLNLGYSGNGPLLEFATLKEYLTPKVKKVLWLYFEGNDLLDLKDEIKDKKLYKYVEDVKFIKKIKEKQKEVNLLANVKLNEALNNVDYFKETNKIENDRLIQIKKQKKEEEIAGTKNR